MEAPHSPSSVSTNSQEEREEIQPLPLTLEKPEVPFSVNTLREYATVEEEIPFSEDGSRKPKRKFNKTESSGKGVLTLGQRLDILQFLDDIDNKRPDKKYKTQSDIASFYNVSSVTITKIKKNKDLYKNRHENGSNASSKRLYIPSQEMENFDQAIVDYIDMTKTCNTRTKLGVSTKMIFAKAEEIAKMQGIKNSQGKEWKANPGWYSRLLKRKNIKKLKTTDDATETEEDDENIVIVPGPPAKMESQSST